MPQGCNADGVSAFFLARKSRSKSNITSAKTIIQGESCQERLTKKRIYIGAISSRHLSPMAIFRIRCPSLLRQQGNAVLSSSHKAQRGTQPRRPSLSRAFASLLLSSNLQWCLPTIQPWTCADQAALMPRRSANRCVIFCQVARDVLS